MILLTLNVWIGNDGGWSTASGVVRGRSDSIYPPGLTFNGYSWCRSASGDNTFCGESWSL